MSRAGTQQERDEAERELAKAEHDAWRDLVAALKAAGAVTDADCASRRLQRAGTPGQRVFDAINTWGVALVEMKGARC